MAGALFGVLTVGVSPVSATIGGTLTFSLVERLYPGETGGTYNIKLKSGSSSITALSNVKAGSYSYTVPASLVTWATSPSIVVTVSATLSDGKYETEYGQVTITIPNSYAPAISNIACTDAKGYLSTYGGFIQGQSQLSVAITASAKSGASIKSYGTRFDGIEASGNNAKFQTGIAGSRTVTGYATDSRGMTGSGATTINVLAYSAPKVTGSADRVNGSGKADQNGANIKVSSTSTITSLNGQNTKTVQIRYKTSTSNTWGAWQTGETLTFAANVDYAYDVQIKVSDRFTSSTIQRQVPASFVLVDYGGPDVNGEAIAFGGAATTFKTFVNHLITHFRNEITSYGYPFRARFDDVSQATAPSTSTYKRTTETYAQDGIVGFQETGFLTSGHIRQSIGVGRLINGTQTWRQFYTALDTDGSSFHGGTGDYIQVGNANTTESSLRLQTKSRTSQVVRVHDGDGYGAAVLYGLGGGLTIVGAGEYAHNRYAVGDLAATLEHLYLGADGNVQFESNGNTISNRKTMTFTSGGSLIINTGGSFATDATNLTQGTAPSSTITGPGYQVRDVNGSWLSRMTSRFWSSGTQATLLETHAIIHDVDYYNTLTLGVTKDCVNYVSVTDPIAWKVGLSAANRTWKKIGSWTGAGSTNWTTDPKGSVLNSEYAFNEFLITAQFSNKLFSTVVPFAALKTSEQELWIGGGKDNQGSGAQGSARALIGIKYGTATTLKYIYAYGVAANNASVDTLSSTTFTIYCR